MAPIRATKKSRFGFLLVIMEIGAPIWNANTYGGFGLLNPIRSGVALASNQAKIRDILRVAGIDERSSGYRRLVRDF